MKIAYIILAHKNQEQLLRMISRLSHPSADCWLHIDRKWETIELSVLSEFKNIHIIQPRIKVSWGCFNIVEAMLNGMKAVLKAGQKYDYIHFLSGQDYPIQPPDHFMKYLAGHKGYEFIGHRPYEETRGNMERISRYHFPAYSFPGKSVFEQTVNAVLPERIFPYDFSIRKGPQWMTLSLPAARYVLRFVSDNPMYANYFKWVNAPDEFFFQTILYNSPFRLKMRNQIFHYIDWSEKKKSPKVLTIKDLESLLSSDFFFARKFDTSADPSILDALDERIFSFPAVK